MLEVLPGFRICQQSTNIWSSAYSGSFYYYISIYISTRSISLDHWYCFKSYSTKSMDWLLVVADDRRRTHCSLPNNCCSGNGRSLLEPCRLVLDAEILRLSWDVTCKTRAGCGWKISSVGLYVYSLYIWIPPSYIFWQLGEFLAHRYFMEILRTLGWSVLFQIWPNTADFNLHFSG